MNFKEWLYKKAIGNYPQLIKPRTWYVRQPISATPAQQGTPLTRGISSVIGQIAQSAAEQHPNVFNKAGITYPDFWAQRRDDDNDGDKTVPGQHSLDFIPKSLRGKTKEQILAALQDMQLKQKITDECRNDLRNSEFRNWEKNLDWNNLEFAGFDEKTNDPIIVIAIK